MIEAVSKFKKTLYQKKYRNKIIIFLHLIKKAEHIENKEYLGGRPIICKPGQVLTNRKLLCKETGINEKTIEHCLTVLEQKDKLIQQQKTNKNRLITISSYKSEILNEQQNEIDVNNRDNRIATFIDRCKGMSYSDNDWYKALMDLKINIINDYINKHIIFEEKIKRRVRELKEKNIKDEFYNEILPYFENISEKNKERLTKDKYNNNRNLKNRQKSENS